MYTVLSVASCFVPLQHQSYGSRCCMGLTSSVLVCAFVSPSVLIDIFFHSFVVVSVLPARRYYSHNGRMHVPLAAQGWLQGVGLPIPNGIVLLPLLVRGLWMCPRTVKSNNEVALIVPSIILAGQRVPRSLSSILSHYNAFAWEIGSIAVDTANYDPILVKR
jgi:hypothetical protein